MFVTKHRGNEIIKRNGFRAGITEVLCRGRRPRWTPGRASSGQ